jgi:hypothetical protein
MAEDATQPKLSPDEELATSITEAIGAANLVNAQKLPRIREGLLRGNLTSGEWKLLAELGPAVATKEGASGL